MNISKLFYPSSGAHSKAIRKPTCKRSKICSCSL
uniref:Uncharacterized protein n=1 Tax=Anguilla anguilla TaxID=7936 RepID=A0A0E9PEY0_ANGAN